MTKYEDNTTDWSPSAEQSDTVQTTRDQLSTAAEKLEGEKRLEIDMPITPAPAKPSFWQTVLRFLTAPLYGFITWWLGKVQRQLLM